MGSDAIVDVPCGRDTGLLNTRQTCNRIISQTHRLLRDSNWPNHIYFYSLVLIYASPVLCVVVIPMLTFAYVKLKRRTAAVAQDEHQLAAMLTAYEHAQTHESKDDAVYVHMGLLSIGNISSVDKDLMSVYQL